MTTKRRATTGEARLASATVRHFEIRDAGGVAKILPATVAETLPNLFSIPRVGRSAGQESDIWARVLRAGHEQFASSSAKGLSESDSLKLAKMGTEEQRIELASSTMHEKVQQALSRDKSHLVHDTLLHNEHLTTNALKTLISQAQMGEDYATSEMLKARLPKPGKGLMIDLTQSPAPKSIKETLRVP